MKEKTESFEEKMFRKNIVYGWTFEAERFYFQYSWGGKKDIAGIVDKALPSYWYGVELISEEAFWTEMQQNMFIYIAYPFGSAQYGNIKKKLEERGLIEFNDFWGTESYGKKMVIINANCHTVPYREYLCASKLFMEKYYIYPLEPILSRKPVEISDNILKNCDVYIHQIISEHNPYSNKISDKYVYSILKKECIKLSVPNFMAGPMAEYEKFYYPQLGGFNTKHARIHYGLGIFFRSDMVIDECVCRGYGFDAIIRAYENEELISEEQIRGDFSEFLRIFKKAEEKWTVKISDYFEEGYNEKILTAIGHPGRLILQEIGRRILFALNIEEDVSFDFEYLDEYPLLECVSRALGIKRHDFIRGEKKSKIVVLCDKRMDLKEYVKQYIYWIHGYELKKMLSNIAAVVGGMNYILFCPTVYVRELLKVMDMTIMHTLEGYQVGTPVVIMEGLHIKDKIKDCIDAGVKKNSIYIIERNDNRKKQLIDLIYRNEKVVVYGMGNDYRYLIDDDCEGKVVVCDRKIKNNRMKGDIEYITINTLLSKYKDTPIYVTSTRYGNEIRNELCEKGVSADRIVLNETPMKNNVLLSHAKIVPLAEI